MNRTELQTLAGLRLKEASVLLQAGCVEGSYYLAGYAIECAIKACFARKTEQHDFPNKKSVDKIYKHDPRELITGAGLEEEWDKELKSNQAFRGNWGLVKEWSEEKRYATGISENDAKDLLNAIDDPANGVFTWLKKFW
jgi:HEPN domain-containing protein